MKLRASKSQKGRHRRGNGRRHGGRRRGHPGATDASMTQLNSYSSERSSRKHHTGRMRAAVAGSERENPDHTYKTEMCNNWIEFGSCRYNKKCRFAHGEEELRVARRIISDKSWKSELCRNFHADGTCSYGRRCHFIHDESPEDLARMHQTQKRVSTNKTRRATKFVVLAPAGPDAGAPAFVPLSSSAPARVVREPRSPLDYLAQQVDDSALVSTSTPPPKSALHSLCVDTTIGAAVNPPAVPVSPFPVPIARKRSLLAFNDLFIQPVENPQTPPPPLVSASDREPDDLRVAPFLFRQQEDFGHMRGKVISQPKMLSTPPRQVPPATVGSMRLPIFRRIASDTGVVENSPSSPMSGSP